MRTYPYTRLEKYPHLSKLEGAIWDRYIELHPGVFDRVHYDVQVGDRRADDTDLADEWRRNADYLGAYKIDVIAENDDVLMLVELKHEATTKALGEVWLYETLYKKRYRPTKPVVPAIVTDIEMPNIREVAEADGVKLLVVGMPSPEPTESDFVEDPQQEEENDGTENNVTETTTVL